MVPRNSASSVGPRRPAGTFSVSSAGPRLEQLEERLLLNGAAPVFATPLVDQFMTTDGALTIGINGFDADGDALTITAVSDNPNLVLTIPTGNRFAALNFVQSDGAPIGQIVVQLFDGCSPTATERLVTLATNYVYLDGTLDPFGVPFYTDVDIHRVIQDFMIQTGDAVLGTGFGGSPLGTFPDAFDPVLSFSGVGALAMANSGADTNDCQFFITTGPAPWLDQAHMIFGQVVSGWVVLGVLNTVSTDANNRPDQFPYDPPRLAGIELIDNNHDGTLTMQYMDPAGGVANVTVKLDDGNGNLTQQIFAVSILGFEASGVITVQPGTPAAHPLAVNGNPGPDSSGLNWNVFTQSSEVLISVDDDTSQLLVLAPADYTGAALVTVQVALEGDARTVTRSFHVAIQNPLDKPIVSGLLPSAGANYYSGAVAGDLLYVAAGGAGIEVYDASDRSNPLLLGAYNTAGEARYIEVVGDYAFVSDTFNGLVTLNVSDPSNITLVSTTSTGSAALGLAVRGDVLFVASYGGGLRAYDISNPLSVTFISGIVQLFQTPGGSAGFQQAMDVALYGNYAYVSEWGAAVVVLDVTNPAAMKYVTWIPAFTPWGLDVSGKTLFVADSNAGLTTWDLSRPKAPKLLSQLDIPEGPWHVRVYNEVAVVGNFDNGYALVDVYKPSAMGLIYTVTTSIAGGQAGLLGSHLVLPIGAEGAVLMDATGLVNRLTVQGKRAIVDGNGTVVTFTASKAVVYFYMTVPIGGDIDTIEVVPLAGSASVKVAAKPAAGVARPAANGIYVSGDMKTFSAAVLDLNGDFIADGLVATLILGNLTGGTVMLPAPPGGSTAVATLRFDQVSDSSIISGTPIKSLTVTDWTDAGGDPDLIDAPWIGTLTVRGDRKRGLAGHFDASLNLSGPAVRQALANARIAGQILGGTWEIVGPVGTIRAALGMAGGWVLDASGDVRVLDGGTGELGGAVTADTFGTVRTRGALSADIVALGADARGVSINSLTAGAAGNATVAAAGGINTLRAAEWIGGSIGAGWLRTLQIIGDRRTGLAGDFQADLVLSGGAVPAGKATLNTARIAGDLSGALWDVQAGFVGSLTFIGTVRNSIVRSAGNIKGLVMGAGDGSDFAAGVALSVVQADRHVAVGDVANTPQATIGAFTVKGWKLPAGAPVPRFFIDSHVSAAVGKVSVLNWDGLGGLFAPAGGVGSVQIKESVPPAAFGPDDFVNII